ncbi:MAG: hypothetical protein ACOCV2_12465 [Persicimonas sp.]
MVERIVHFMGLTAAVAIAAGCVDQDQGAFELADIERDEECLQEASPVEPSKFGVREQRDTITLFMETDYRLASLGDGVLVELYQPDTVRENLGEPVELADPLELVEDDEKFDDDPVARAQLLVDESCPGLDERLGLRGEIIFEAIGTERGDDVVGRIENAEAVSLRREDVAIGSVTGQWDYTIKMARPYKYYPDYEMGDDSDGPAP